uniref:Pseudouridylate synthase RPUSD4, mitochondrial n=1 Tax=Schistosoma mansoni TaxID=6183 RepID=A0A5K4F0A4_SCHMA
LPLFLADNDEYIEDYFGIEYDQKVEGIKHEENKCKALLSVSKNIIDEQYFGVNDDDDDVKLHSGTKNSSEITVLQSDTSHLDDLCSTGSNTNPMEDISSVVNNTVNPLVISQHKARIGKKHIPHLASTITTTNTHTDITSKSNINLRKQGKLVHGTKTVRVDHNVRRNNNSDSLKFNENDDDGHHHNDGHHHDDDVEYGSDVVRIIRQRTKLNLYTGTTLDIPSNKSTSTSIPEKLDSQGYRIPDEDPYKFDLLTEEEAAMVLYKSIIEIRENVIALNKPRGIASQPGADCKHNIVDLLPRIESLIRKRNHHGKGEEKYIGELSTVHRLDKDSSGIILIARNKDSALKLQEAFSRRWIKKDYLCITVGIPRSDYGYIQLPLVERNFNGIRKMCTPQLNRRLQELTCKQTQLDIDNEANEYDVTDAFTVLYDKMRTNNNQPTTWYNLIDKQNNAALMLCSTLTGIKHQIRAHLAFGLHTPILGDHKYSHAEYLAPQRLPKSLLEVLNIRQSKVRYIGLHLHALSLHLHIPPSSSSSSSSLSSSTNNEGFFDFIRSFEYSHSNNTMAKNKFIRNPLKFSAPLPNHFQRNLKRIGLKLPYYLKYLHG